MSASSSGDESSQISVGELSLYSVRFAPGGVQYENEYMTQTVQNLDDIPHFIAAKHYDALPLEQYNALNDSICKIWSAFLATDFKVNGDKSCVNEAVGHSMYSNVDAGDGMLARVSETCVIKGRIVGPDDSYPHLTKVSSDDGCDEVQLRTGVTYIIHGDAEGEVGPGRSEMDIPSLSESFLRLGITEFCHPPYSHRVWSIKGSRLVGTMNNALERLCNEHCAAECDNVECLNGQKRAVKYMYVKSDKPLKVYDFGTRYDPLGARYARQHDDLRKVLKKANPAHVTQKRLLRTLMVFKKLQRTLSANKCWVLPGNGDEGTFNPGKAYLKANATYLWDLYPHDADGDAVSLWDGGKVRVTTYGQVAHVCTKSGSLLEPGTQNFAWAGHVER